MPYSDYEELINHAEQNLELKNDHELWQCALEGSLLQQDVYLQEQPGISNFKLFAGLYYHKLSNHQKALEHGFYHAQYDAVMNNEYSDIDIFYILNECCKLHRTPGYLLKATYLTKHAHYEEAIICIKVAEKLLPLSKASIHNCYYGRSISDATGFDRFEEAVDDILKRADNSKINLDIIDGQVQREYDQAINPHGTGLFLSNSEQRPLSRSSSCSSARPSEIESMIASLRP